MGFLGAGCRIAGRASFDWSSEQKIGAEKRESENLAPWRTPFTCLEGELHPKPDRASGLKQIRLSVSAVNSVAGSSSTKISLVQQALDVIRTLGVRLESIAGNECVARCDKALGDVGVDLLTH
jgi:hypothetical protein